MSNNLKPFLNLIKKERAAHRNIRYKGKFHDLIEDMKRNIAIKEVRQQNIEQIAFEFSDFSINYDVSNN